MKTTPVSVRKIFETDKRLLVPLFQRPYVWTQRDQWDPLWLDIQQLVERKLGGKEVHPHFMGAVVLDQLPNQTGSLEQRMVVDGQQRLTTIQLLLQAAVDVLSTVSAEQPRARLAKLVRNDETEVSSADEIFKVWPTTVDQERFRLTMHAKTVAGVRAAFGKPADGGHVGHAIGDAYIYFSLAIQDWLQQQGHQPAAIDALVEVIRDRLSVVVIDLDHEDDAQLIFETLNARGTPLLPADLIKNLLLQRAVAQKEPTEALYETHWKPFEHDASYWRASVGTGHAQRARLDTFLQHYLTLRTRDDVPVAHLYATFRDYLEEEETPKSVAYHLGDIALHAAAYRNFDSIAVTSRAGLFFSRLAAMDIVSATPFLLHLFVKHKHEPAEIDRTLGMLESFLVRRMVTQLNTRGYSRLFLELLKQVEASTSPVSTSVQEFLLKSDADSSRWPDDKEFRTAWLDTPMYRALVRKRVSMLLQAIELALRGPMTEAITLPAKLSLEHVMPQRWRDNWATPPQAEGEQPEEAQQRRDRLIHRIGNLTLVTVKLNASLSNAPWLGAGAGGAGKRAALDAHSVLMLNKHVCKVDDWTEAAIDTRSEGLFEIARGVWPHPTEIPAVST